MYPTSRPGIDSSTRDERLAYVRQRYACISNCESCGLCVLFRHEHPEDALADYIDGKEELSKVLMRYR